MWYAIFAVLLLLGGMVVEYKYLLLRRLSWTLDALLHKVRP